ncbi:hypothetical protein I4U23_001417 [Adineta vaga]|nr:hypothetical protein I4U23_001417 [Adineta vaga]
MTSNSDVIERKVVDVSGRLGSLYDAIIDDIVKQHSIQATRTQKLEKSSVCQLFEGSRSRNGIDYFNKMDIDDAMQTSILLDLVHTSGVSCLANYYDCIDQNTRFLYYSYRSKQEELDITSQNVKEILPNPSLSTTATHVINKIVWGFEILCIIQISTQQSSEKIDGFLERVSNQLKNYEESLTITDDEKQQINELKTVVVYGSETCVENAHVRLLDILYGIQGWKRHDNFHHPLKYTMRCLNGLYGYKHFPKLAELSTDNNNTIEQMKSTITSLNGPMKYYKVLFDKLPKEFKKPTLNQMLKDANQYYNACVSKFKIIRQNHHKLLTSIRQGQYNRSELNNLMADEQYSSKEIGEIHNHIRKTYQLLLKENLIEQLSKDNIRYINVLDLQCDGRVSITLERVENVIRQTLATGKTHVFVLHSTDNLMHKDRNRWNSFYEQLILKRQQTTDTTELVYVDFTECSHILEEFITPRLLTDFSSQALSNYPTDTNRSFEPISTASSVTEIKILLIGESGCGKSSFINAFVNYLFFDSLQQAEQSQPIVLIPVSFLLTTGDQFEEVTVKFGEADGNENFEHIGQSVTQQCRSYLLELNDKIHLRFIDTPGMGDTRGIDQDEKNIHHILTYVNNLSHLNAICLLLKPNTSRLNIFFRSCVHQLLTYLTPVGYRNIIFCFTNARSTFFAPGDTGPLLRKMLQQEPFTDVPFRKENTFCFDSESFRYLAARKCHVTFDTFQMEEYQQSWTKSVSESHRLLRFIKTRDAYILDECPSQRKYTFEISLLARPLMETLRLFIYNWKLRATGHVTQQIILEQYPINGKLCTSCAQNDIVNVHPFWIVQYGSAKDNNKEPCFCSAEDSQFLLEYSVKHSIDSSQVDVSSEEFEKKYHGFLYQCDKLAYFFRQQGLPNQDDPFTSILDRFLDEERHISEKKCNKGKLNKGINDELRAIKRQRQQNKKRLIDLDEKLSLHDVYLVISSLKSMPEIRNQIECIQISRRLKMEETEHRVKIPSINNKILASITD